MRARSVERLVCPLCYGPFRWEEVERSGDRILSARVPCPNCGTVSAVIDGIGYFRPGDAGTGTAPALAGAPSASGEAPDGWELALGRARDRIAEKLLGSKAPSVELAFRGFAPGLLFGSGLPEGIVAAEEGSLPPSPGSIGAWDLCLVEPHSLPFRERSMGSSVLGPGLQDTPGTRIILRELLRRTTTGGLAAVVVYPLPPTGPLGRPEGSVPLTHGPALAALLEEFERGHWSPRLDGTGTVRLPTPEEPTGIPYGVGVIFAAPR